MNIYDFAGNEWEWTLEHATLNADYPSANRGGGYCYGGDKYPITNRGENQTTRSIYDVGFRTTFYDQNNKKGHNKTVKKCTTDIEKNKKTLIQIKNCIKVFL